MTNHREQRDLGHAIGLLRDIVRNLALIPIAAGPITIDTLRSHGFARSRLGPSGLGGILRPGHESFIALIEILFSGAPRIERGTTFATFEDELFGFLLSEYWGRESKSIDAADVLSAESHLSAWFDERAANRTVFIPCMICPSRSPRFSIGPVTLIHIDDIATSEFYVRANGVEGNWAFDRLIEEMRKERAHWLAIVEIEDYDQKRGQEIAELTVDLAIVSLQLAAPHLGTKNMSRLADRRGPGIKLTLSISEDANTGGWTRLEPGTAIGEDYLGQIVRETSPIISAVGNCVRSFATGLYRLPKLEQAWCDAAYWLHQGLAEPSDSIAVAKLETAIEVLFQAENAGGSEGRMLSALECFYGLGPDDPIIADSRTTAREFARGFVRDRSRILHGTWSTLHVRMAESRDGLENFATTLVRAAVTELDIYLQTPSPTDDTEAFLAWVKTTRQARRASTEDQP